MQAYSNYPSLKDSGTASRPMRHNNVNALYSSNTVPQKTLGLNTSHSTVELRKLAKRPQTQTSQPVLFSKNTSRTASLPVPTMARPVHRAKSSPSLTSDGKKPAYPTSTNIPPMPPSFDFHEGKPPSPLPRSLLGDRFSNASSMTTTTTTTTISTYSDRSSGSSNIVFPVSQKSLLSRPIPPIEIDPPLLDSSSMRSSAYAHSYTDSLNSQYISAIDIINDYTDDPKSPVPSTFPANIKDTTNSPLHQDRINASTRVDKQSKIVPASPLTSTALTRVPSTLHTPPPIGQTDASRDRYGFKKQTSHITQIQHDKWWASYQPYTQRRKKKWVKLMKDAGIPTTNGTSPVKFPPKSEKGKLQWHFQNYLHQANKNNHL